MTTLYHREVFMPEKYLTKARARVVVFASGHAKREAASDRYGAINIPESLVFGGDNIVEVEVDGVRTVKYVVRVRYNELDDLVIALQPDGLIRTVWRNRRTDTHKTLQINLYATK